MSTDAQTIVFGCLTFLCVCIVIGQLAKRIRPASPEGIRAEQLLNARRGVLQHLAAAEDHKAQADMLEARIARLALKADDAAA